GGFVDVDDALRLREHGRHAHVGRENLAVAIEDVGPRGSDRVMADDAPRMAFGHRREQHEPAGNDRVAEREHENDEPDARARLGGAVDPAAVEQAVDEAQAPRTAWRFAWRLA